MIASATHTQEARARGVAVWVSGFTLGALVGPVIGGVAAQAHYGADVNAGWRWAFLVVLVLAVASAGLSFLAQDSLAPEGRCSTGPARSRSPSPFSPCCSRSFRAHQRLGQRAGDRLLHRRRRLRRGVRRRRTPVSGAAAAARVFPAPQLRGDLVVTVVGMFAFLGTVYAIAIRLATVQGFSPLKTYVASVWSSG